MGRVPQDGEMSVEREKITLDLYGAFRNTKTLKSPGALPSLSLAVQKTVESRLKSSGNYHNGLAAKGGATEGRIKPAARLIRPLMQFERFSYVASLFFSCPHSNRAGPPWHFLRKLG